MPDASPPAPGPSSLPVGAREPAPSRHRFDVVVEMRVALHEVRQVLVRQVDRARWRNARFASSMKYGRSHCRRRASRGAASPTRLGFVQADLDEVVAPAQRADLAGQWVGLPIALLEPGSAFKTCVQSLWRGASLRHGNALVDVDPWPAAEPSHAVLESKTFCAILSADRSLESGRQPRGHHAAADIDADRGRNDRADRRDHRADGRAPARCTSGMTATHGARREVRRRCELRVGLVFQWHATHPALDRRGAAFGMQQSRSWCS